jgi:hypothetical protein
MAILSQIGLTMTLGQSHLQMAPQILGERRHRLGNHLNPVLEMARHETHRNRIGYPLRQLSKTLPHPI